jgi:ABC-2 type transport system ATP-binding protein
VHSQGRKPLDIAAIGSKPRSGDRFGSRVVPPHPGLAIAPADSKGFRPWLRSDAAPRRRGIWASEFSAMSTATLANSSSLAIDLAYVAKTYKGKVQALRGITMQVHRGEVFGLLGPNGAGKSTLVKILMTVIRPSRCEGAMLGKPVGHKDTLGRVGYLPEHHRFPDYLTGAQVLDFYAAMAKVARPERRRRSGELLELVGMSDWANKKVRSYSKGMRQRIGIAQALMNEPDLVILDEPTDGVDPVGRRDIRNVLLELKSRGKTVFLNSHLLSELEMVCDRVAILVQGVVSAQGTIDELTHSEQRYEIEIAAGSAAEGTQLIKAAIGPMSEIGWEKYGPPNGWEKGGILQSGQPCEVRECVLRVGTTDPEAVQPLIDTLRARGVVIRSVRPFRPSLEDLFMRAVTDPNTGEVLAPGALGRPSLRDGRRGAPPRSVGAPKEESR